MQKGKKALSLIYLACGLVSWLLFREVAQSIWVLVHLPRPLDWIVAPSDLIAIGFGIATFVILLSNAKVTTFTGDVVSEMSRVVWPGRKETALSTGIVSMLVAICALILFVVDMFWGFLVRIFYQ